MRHAKPCPSGSHLHQLCDGRISRTKGDGRIIKLLGHFAHVMKKQHVLRWLTIGLVMLVASLLAFIGSEVLSTVFPSDAIVITASDGASLRVDGRALEVLGGSAGTTSFAPLTRPVAVGLFAVLVVFALIGAASLFRDERQTTRWPNQSAAANRRPAGQADGSDDLSATIAADRAFPAAVAELDRSLQK